MCSRASTSRCASGSSSSSTSGSRRRQAARPTSLRCPPERIRVGLTRSSSSSPTSPSSARARPSKPGPPAAVQQTLLAAEQALEPVEVDARCLDGALDLRELALELVEVRPRGAQRLERPPLVALQLLRQEGEIQPAPLRDLACVRGLLAHEDPEQ